MGELTEHMHTLSYLRRNTRVAKLNFSAFTCVVHNLFTLSPYRNKFPFKTNSPGLGGPWRTRLKQAQTRLIGGDTGMTSFFQFPNNAELKWKSVQSSKLSRSLRKKKGERCTHRDREAQQQKKTGANFCHAAQRQKLKPKGEGGGKKERAVWLIETESTDRKSLSCHWAEHQSLFILLTSALSPAALSPGSSSRHLPATFTRVELPQTGRCSQKELLPSLRRQFGATSFWTTAVEFKMTDGECFYEAEDTCRLFSLLI